MRDATRLTQLELDQEQRDLLNPLRKTGRYELPAQAE